MDRLHEWDAFTEWEPTNNDLEPSEGHWADYAAFWDVGREWVHPHPDMEGYVCSNGFAHVAYQRSPVAPVGLARLAA